MRNRSLISLLSFSIVYLLTINIGETAIYKYSVENSFSIFVCLLIFFSLTYSCIKINSDKATETDYALLFVILLSTSWFGDSYARICVQIAVFTLAISSTSISKLGINRYLIFYLLFSISLLGSLIRTFKVDLDFILVKDNILLTDSKYILENFNHITAHVFWPTVNFLEYLSIFFLPLLLKKVGDPQKIVRGVRLGILLALPIAMTVLLFQIYHPTPLTSLNNNNFWVSVGRYSSIFSDPNAFGIMSAVFILVLMFFANKETWKTNIIASIIYFCLSMFSGSRSFFLVLILASLSLIFQNQTLIKRHIKKLLALVFTLLFLTIGFRDSLPPSLQRLYSTLNPTSMLEQLNSRIVYLKLGLEAVAEYPILGLGFGRFYFMQEQLAKATDINLGIWRDNANNYYLQLASEGGVIALILFLSGLFILFNQNLGPIGKKARLILLIIMISLIFGPHLNFIEFKLIFIILISVMISDANLIDTRSVRNLPTLLFVSCIYLLLQICVPPYNEENRSYGFHSIEKQKNLDNEVGYYRWSGSRGKICFDPTGRGQSRELTIFNGNPNQSIELRYGEKYGDSLTFKPGEKLSLNLSENTRYFEFKVFNPWLPSKILKSPDNRLIGLQFEWEKDVECLS